MRCGISDAFQPVAYNLFSIGSQYRFRVKLDAVNIVFLMFQCHDLTFGADGGDNQFFGKFFRIHYPGVITTDWNFSRKTGEYVIFILYFHIRLYAVKDFTQIGELPAECLSDGLFTQADAKYGFSSCVSADDL